MSTTSSDSAVQAQDATAKVRKPRKQKDPNAPVKAKKPRVRVLFAIFEVGDGNKKVFEFRPEKRPEGAPEGWKGQRPKDQFNEWYNDEATADQRPNTVPMLIEGVKIKLQTKI